MIRHSFLGLLAAASLLITVNLVACSDDDEGSDPNGGSDGDSDSGSGDVADDGATDSADLDDLADLADLADLIVGSGTIGGNIFYNGPPLTGTLTIAIYDSPPTEAPFGEPLLSIIEEAPSLPSHPYQFTDVPAGPVLYMIALLDIAGNDPFDLDPGDLFGTIEGPFGVLEDGAVIENVNIELF